LVKVGTKGRRLDTAFNKRFQIVVEHMEAIGGRVMIISNGLSTITISGSRGAYEVSWHCRGPKFGEEGIDIVHV
jgi:hypothetical protein